MLSELFPGRCERLFERFRRHGDAAALGAVFDRTAPELAALAVRLAPSRELAQELVQTTYLAAMESAAVWDARRRLMPWLVGILVREARRQRRCEGREVDPARLAEVASPDPSRAAADSEFAHAVAGALAGVPPRYREVLALHLGADKTPAEIARELGRASGTVRVQLHRGLAHLRRALPAGFATAGALAVLAPRALSDVRARILAHAARAGVPFGVGPVLVGGWMMKKLALAGLLALVVGGGFWFLRAPHGRESTVTEARPQDPASALAGVAPPPAPESTGQREERAVTPGPGTHAAPEASASEPMATGIRGRLVEADGGPVGATRVELADLPPELFVVDAWAALTGGGTRPQPAFAGALTDAEGRFTIRGQGARSVHALGIDPGGPRASLRILEEALHLGETTDLGDIVLAPVGTVVGRVVDEAGLPVAEARVRVAALPERVLEHGLHRWRATSLLVPRLGREAPLAALELPGWTATLLARLPIPSTRTAPDGSFALYGPLGVELTLVVDDPRHEPCLRRELVLAPGSARELGTLTLSTGRTLVCRVVDAAGQALDGAEVFAGTLGESGRLAVCAPAEPAEEPGLYRCSGLSPGPEILAARVAGGAWHVAGPFEGAGIREVRLGTLRTLTLDARDEQGRGVSGLGLALQAADALAHEDETAFLEPVRPAGEGLRQVDATTYVVSGLAERSYRLFAWADGCAPLRSTLEVRGEAPSARLVFGAASALRVRVVDDASGAPLSGAEVTLRAGRQGRYTRLGSGRTDGDGRASLARVVALGKEELHVRAERVGHAPGAVTLAEGAPAPGEELVLRLARPGRLVGQVREAGRAPSRRYLVALQPLEPALRNPANVPFHALTDAEGRFVLSDLPPGDFRYQVGERFLEGDPLSDILGGRLGEAFDADKGILERRLQQGMVQVAAGGETRLEILLAPPAESAALRGRLVRDGRSWAGLELELELDGGVKLLRRSDERGAFDFGRVAAGEVRLKVEDVVRGRTVLRAELRLEPGEERVLALDFGPFTVAVALVGAAGPMADVHLELRPPSSLYEAAAIEARTDASGSCRVTLPGCGSYAWSAAAGALVARGSVDVLSDAPLTLTFRAPVAVQAKIELAPDLVGESRAAFLAVQVDLASDVPLFSLVPLDLSRPELELSFDGPGRYELVAMCGPRRSRVLVLEVPPSGLEGQVLRFELGE